MSDEHEEFEDGEDATECDICGIAASDTPIFWNLDGYYCAECAYS